jgi:hypothetical protein
MSAEYLSQGYPLLAESQAGRRYAVVGWCELVAGAVLVPIIVPVDAPGGRPARQEGAMVEGVELAFSTSEPARELAAEILGVLDRWSEWTPDAPLPTEALDLVATLRALLASWRA